jgi:uncharacterized Zn-finger protein
MAFNCTACNKRFNNLGSLQQHRDSLVHAPIFECEECDRSFGSDQALQQHLSSPAHAPVFECDKCDRSFGSKEALQQHRKSPRHPSVSSRNPSSAPLTLIKAFDFPRQEKTGGRIHTTEWKLNSETGLMMDMTQDQD